MKLKPTEWSVVIVGRWNPAIFTPAGISSRFFKLPQGTPVEVLVILDDVAPPKVRHEGLAVSAGQLRLAVDLLTNSFESLAKAMSMAAAALEGLPETPVSAAGFNLRYRADPLPDSLIPLFGDQLDKLLSDAGHDIVERSWSRGLPKWDGQLNVAVTAAANEPADLVLNFDRKSKNVAELVAWLRTPIDQVRDAATEVLRTLGLTQQEIDYEDNN
jgi:hypothetical protein